MTLPLRLFFDECCSTKLAAAIYEFFSINHPDLEVLHLEEFAKRGDDDRVWLDKLSSEEGWIVISKDHGRSGKSEKLPTICQELGITHILFTSGIINGGFTAQQTAFAEAWQDIMLAPECPKGTKLKLGYASGRRSIKRAILRVGSNRITSFLKSN